MTTKFTQFVEGIERTSSPEERAALAAARRRFSIGARLLQRRLAAGLTQQQLAEASEVPQSEISRIERGQANPTARTLEALGRPLGVVLDYTPLDT